MENKEQNNDWLWVVVCNPGKEETLLGLYDKNEDIHFVPTFDNKDDADNCFHALPTIAGNRYEIQAIHIEELNKSAKEGNFIVSRVDGSGNIIK